MKFKESKIGEKKKILCPKCDGVGKEENGACSDCQGTGYLEGIVVKRGG